MWFSWDEWVDAAKLSATGGRRLGRPPKAAAPAAPSRNARPAPERRAASGGADAEEVAALKEHVAELSAANASRARRPAAPCCEYRAHTETPLQWRSG